MAQCKDSKLKNNSLLFLYVPHMNIIATQILFYHPKKKKKASHNMHTALQQPHGLDLVYMHIYIYKAKLLKMKVT